MSPRPFDYETTKLAEGFYIVEVYGKREVAEWNGYDWNQTGYDYDHWQYDRRPTVITILARIDLDTLVAITE
jgi:hypothetical protein